MSKKKNKKSMKKPAPVVGKPSEVQILEKPVREQPAESSAERTLPVTEYIEPAVETKIDEMSETPAEPCAETSPETSEVRPAEEPSVPSEEEATKKKKLKVGDVLLTVLTILLAVIAFRVVKAKVNHEPYFMLNRYSLIWVLTDSMEPNIPAESYILVEKANGAQVDVGDVISFVSPDPVLQGSLNTHRIARVEGTGSSRRLITKGDNNIVEDSYPVSPEAVVAKFVKTLPLLSVIGKMARTNIGFLLMILLVFGMMIMVIASTILQIKAEKMRMARKQQIQNMIDAEVERIKASGGLNIPDLEAKIEEAMKSSPSK